MRDFETKREEMLYHIIDFLYESLGPANDDIMDMAEAYAAGKMQEA